MSSNLITRRLREERLRLSQMLPESNRAGLMAFSLTYDDVLDAHFAIADFFYREEYGMAGVGFREAGMFISTVERQFIGFQGCNAYANDFEVVATLMLGIIKNHPFYDGNKRTAFLCALLQLHKMGRTITVAEKEFEDLMVEIAENSLARRAAIKDMQKAKVAHPEIKYLGRYLQKNSRKNARFTGTVKFRELKRMIEANGFTLANPYRGSVDILKVVERRIPRFFWRDRIERQNVVVRTIAFHGEGSDVPENTVRLVRQACGLTEQDGFDGDVLLRNAQPTFRLIHSYQGALQNLAYR